MYNLEYIQFHIFYYDAKNQKTYVSIFSIVKKPLIISIICKQIKTLSFIIKTAKLN